jgi:uncharacterized membrane protein YagU involved in acid resistance
MCARVAGYLGFVHSCLAAVDGVRFLLVGGLFYTLLPVVVAAVWLWWGALAGIVLRLVIAVAAGPMSPMPCGGA